MLRSFCIFCMLALASASAWGQGTAKPQAPAVKPAGAPARIVLFSQQQPQTLAFEMARERGFYKEEGLEVEFKYFASGTTAFQTFKTGEGDIVYSGDIPAMAYWADSGRNYRSVAVVERNADGYGFVTKAEIKKGADLKGKTVATRVGSTGSHFAVSYLRKYGLDPGKDVQIKNLEGPAMVSALDRGDIDGFFLWEPFPARSLAISGNRVHRLATAKEVVSGYRSLIGARPGWIQADPGRLVRFLRASRKGQELAKNKEAMLGYLKTKFGLERDAVERQYDVQEMLLAFDGAFYKDEGDIARWMQSEGVLKSPMDWKSFAHLDALRKIDPKLAPEPPAR